MLSLIDRLHPAKHISRFVTMESEEGKTRSILLIQITWDPTCPQCYEGKHELDKAMKAFSGDVTFEIMWKPKFLNPDLPEGDLTTQDYLAKKIGAEKAKSALEKLPKYMADLGIEFNTPSYQVPSVKALCLTDYAQSVGKQNETVDQILKAFYVDDQRIDFVDVLQKVALQSGLDQDQATRHISDPAVVARIKEEDLSERAAGHNFVPHFDICLKGNTSNVLSFVGPQPSDTFKSAFQQLLGKPGN